jgi:hypothetical protein
VSEESSPDGPGLAASDEKPATKPEEPRSRRRVLILSCAAAVSLVTIATALVWAVAFPPPGPRYDELPAPCALISLATLDTFLPGATATPQTQPSGAGHAGLCGWSSKRGGQTRTVTAEALIFGPPSGITAAQQAYRSAVSAAICHCQGVSVARQAVTGVGDQATAIFVTVRPGTIFTTLSDAISPDVILDVRSSNALIIISYVTVTATGTVLEPQAEAAQLPAMASMARGVMATLARPAGAPPESIAPLARQPHYAGPRDACRLITAATLATYAPGATVIPLSNPPGTTSPSAQTSTCSWGTNTATAIVLTLNVFPSASSAQQRFNTNSQSLSQSEAGAGVTGAQYMTGLGVPAAAIFQTQNGAHVVEVLVTSGNAELEYSYAGRGGASPDRATLLAGGTAIARDALAALANRAVSSYPRGPMYSSPRNPCTLIKAATLATYIPAVTETQNPGGASSQLPTAPGMQTGQCFFNAGGLNGTQLALFVTIYADPDHALSGFESDVEDTRRQPEVTFNGQQPVPGLGQQATAIFQTAAGAATVNLFVLDGDAELELIFDDAPLIGPAMSHATLLADDVVMAREALASLPG